MTKDEWKQHISNLAEGISWSWPELVVALDEDGRRLWIKCPNGVCTGRVGLTIDQTGLSALVPDIAFVQGSALSGGLSEVAGQVHRYQRMVEALTFAEQACVRVTVTP